MLSPLMVASIFGHTDCVTLLLKKMEEEEKEVMKNLEEAQKKMIGKVLTADEEEKALKEIEKEKKALEKVKERFNVKSDRGYNCLMEAIKAGHK